MRRQSVISQSYVSYNPMFGRAAWRVKPLLVVVAKPKDLRAHPAILFFFFFSFG